MSNEKAEFLARIRETNHTSDNTPRLVFADWLEENEKSERCGDCYGAGHAFCPNCHGEGCSVYGVAANGPCLAADDCHRCAGSGTVSNGFKGRAEFIRVQCRIYDLVNDPDTDWSDCTGPSASWCPNCGDCCCKSREDSMSDDECPLHSYKSNHDSLSLLENKIIEMPSSLSDVFRQAGPQDRGLLTVASVPLIGRAGWLTIGPRIVRDQPIITARLTDRVPLAFGRHFCWHNADNSMRGQRVGTYPTADYLPEWIFNCLTGYLTPESGTNNLMLAYRTRGQADQAVKAVESECLIRWAFQQQEKDE